MHDAPYNDMGEGISDTKHMDINIQHTTAITSVRIHRPDIGGLLASGR
jgi:hypothetical protein